MSPNEEKDPADPQGFIGALAASFKMPAEGHVSAEYVGRHVPQTHVSVDRLSGSKSEGDPGESAALLASLQDSAATLIDELRNPEGPRTEIVESMFESLAGAAPAGSSPLTRADVGGQLGALRDRFGLTEATINTVNEESERTAYWTLVDLITDLRRSWVSSKP